MSGLSLVKHVNRIDQARVITETAPGVSDGRLSRLHLIRNMRVERERVEETDMVPQGDGHWLGFDLAGLEDGYYAAESTNDERVTFFEVRGGGVGWIGHDEKQTIRRMRHAS